jgi:hypothetical protein
LTAPAFRLQPGDLSEVIEAQGESGAKTYCVLYCLRRMPARRGSFKDVRKELEEELRRNPVTPEERVATNLRLRSRSEALKNPKEQR